MKGKESLECKSLHFCFIQSSHFSGVFCQHQSEKHWRAMDGVENCSSYLQSSRYGISYGMRKTIVAYTSFKLDNGPTAKPWSIIFVNQIPLWCVFVIILRENTDFLPITVIFCQNKHSFALILDVTCTCGYWVTVRCWCCENQNMGQVWSLYFPVIFFTWCPWTNLSNISKCNCFATAPMTFKEVS